MENKKVQIIFPHGWKSLRSLSRKPKGTSKKNCVPRIIVEYFVNRISGLQRCKLKYWIYPPLPLQIQRHPAQGLFFPSEFRIEIWTRILFSIPVTEKFTMFTNFKYYSFLKGLSKGFTFITMLQCSKSMSASLFFIWNPNCFKSSKIIISPSESLPA